LSVNRSALEFIQPVTDTNAATQDGASKTPGALREPTPASSTFDFDAFISYRRRDGSAVARWLRSRIESYRPPPGLAAGRKPLKAYVDTTFERATEDFWNQNIEPALRRSRFLAVVVTPSVFEPRSDGEPSWVEREIRVFLSLPNRRNVVVVTAAGNPLDRLPEPLRSEFPRIDVVDLNDLGHRWNFARRATLQDRTLTILARLYDVPDTDMPLLRQEEERRKRRRAVRIATAAFSLAAVLGALLVFALVQWTRAAHARTAAQARSLGLAALADFDSGRHIQALLEAVDGGRKLQTLAPPGASLDEYPTAAPLLALNRVLQGIRERGRREHVEDSMRLQGERTSVETSHCMLPNGDSNSRLAAFMGYRGRLLAMGCTPDGRFLVTTATDGTVRLAELSESPHEEADVLGDAPVNIAQRGQLVGLQGGARFLAFSPDSTHFSTTDVWGTVVDWDLSGASHALQATLNGHRSTVRAISFSPEGNQLATGAIDGEIRTWSTSGQQVGETKPSRDGGAIVAIWLGEHGSRWLAVDGRGHINEWRQNAGALVQRADVADVVVIDAAVASDGLQIGVAIAGGDARVLDLRAGTSASVRSGHSGWIMGVAFPPHADVIATAGADDTVALHRPSGEAVGTPIRAVQDQVMGVTFSPDGRTLATAGEDGTVKLWDRAGALLGQLIGHQGKVLSVRYSPDGRFIASAGADGTVRLWVRSGEQVSQWSGRAGFLAGELLGGGFGTGGISFSPDSRSIAIAELGGAVRIYRIQTLNDLLDDACVWLRPYLSSHAAVPKVCAP
jgi:WD40 repeat protein